ncbi:laccase domain-containing protein, partial [Pseudomonas aeruginosa]
ADCGPILFADPENGVVGAAHAGWKGALTGVVEATVAAMEGLGARRSAIVAVLGPTIAQGAYEVGTDFMTRFRDEAPGSDRFFAAGTRP